MYRGGISNYFLLAAFQLPFSLLRRRKIYYFCTRGWLALILERRMDAFVIVAP